MSAITIIARNTLQEIVREKIFLSIALVSGVLCAFSFLLGEFTFDEQERMIIDVSYFIIEFFGLFLGLYLASSSLRKEIDRQTCLLVLARPLQRYEFILGKSLGFFGVVALFVATLTLLASILSGLYIPTAAIIGLGMMLKIFVVLAWTLAWSQKMRPWIAFFFGFCGYLLSHAHGDFAFFASQSHSEFYLALLKIMRWILPSFDLYNWKNHYVLTHGISAPDVGLMLAQTCAWIVAGLGLSCWIFRSRDIV